MESIHKLITNHKTLALEVWEQLEELNRLDLSKFSDKERKELELSIMELELESSLRNSWISELESLL